MFSILGEATPAEKQELVRLGVLARILHEIEQCVRLDSPTQEKRRSRTSWTGHHNRPSTTGSSNGAGKGVGYGRGSTKSRWDIERTVEERIAQEEHLMWLLCALTTFLCGDALQLAESRPGLAAPPAQPLVPAAALEQLARSPLLALFEDHFSNDSIFDISQHMDFYQALLELATALAYLADFLPHLVRPKQPEARSIAKELIPRFRATLNAYPASIRGQASPDFALMDFIRRVNDLSDVGAARQSTQITCVHFQIILQLTRNYEMRIPPEERVRTAVPRKQASVCSLEAPAEGLPPLEQLGEGELLGLYAGLMQPLQIQTHA